MYIPKRDKNDSPKIIIFSGAGLDAPSGVRTFRDSNGLWNEHKIEDVCTESTWKKNFELVHEFYNQRRMDLGNVKPNHAHKVIKEISDMYPEDVINVTMNVSDLLEMSGIECLHVHGELTKMECVACGNKWEVGYEAWDIEKDSCPECGSKKDVRPSIVFFGGQAPMYYLLNRCYDYLDDPDSIIVVIGTTGSVIDISRKIKHKRCTKILVDLDSVPKDIDPTAFTKIILTGAEEGMKEVKDIINSKRN
jgi:NAD-dependent deacetylase